jgi:hypothetical protein
MITVRFDLDDLAPTELAALLVLMDVAILPESARLQAIEDIEDAGDANCGAEFAATVEAVKAVVS